jgi:poly(3-hydroxybutyrate) depolymerase
LAERNGCQSTPTQLPDVGSVRGLRYTSGSSRGEVLFYPVLEGGHSWPGGKEMPKFIVGKTSADVDATRMIWGFFQQHPMQGDAKVSLPRL